MRVLCCSGGGQLGSAFVGMTLRLVELEKEYDAFYGVSVGSIHSAALAQFKTLKEGNDYAEKLWCSVKTSDVKKHWVPFSILHSPWKCGLFDPSPLKSFLKRHIDVDRLKNSGKKLSVFATNLDTKKIEEFTEKSENIPECVLASSITPFFLSPVSINGSDAIYADGGLRLVCPLQPAIEAGATEVDVLTTVPLDMNPEKVKRDLLNIGMSYIGIMAHEIANNDITNAINKYPDVKINIIRPERPLEGATLDFSQETIQKNIAYGYEMAKKVMG